MTEGMRLPRRARSGARATAASSGPSVNFARDSLVGMGLVLHRLAGVAARRVSAARRRVRGASTTAKLQRHCPAEQARAILKRAREAWADRPVDTTDGVKVRLDDGWFILRGSNTEPIVRVIAEPTEARARAVAEGVMEEVGRWLAPA